MNSRILFFFIKRLLFFVLKFKNSIYIYIYIRRRRKLVSYSVGVEYRIINLRKSGKGYLSNNTESSVEWQSPVIFVFSSLGLFSSRNGGNRINWLHCY